MALEKFNTEALVTVDNGRVGAAFEAALRRVHADCADRPATKKPRKIAIVVTIVPEIDEKGDLDSCNLSFEVQDSLPKRVTRIVNMRAANGQLLFNEMSPDDARQSTIDSVGPRGVVSETVAVKAPKRRGSKTNAG